MPGRVAECAVRTGRFGPTVRFRADLHGVLRFGPRGSRDLIRWEWIQEISVDEAGGVKVRSNDVELRLPPGAFGLSPEVLADRLRAAQSIERRVDVLGELSGDGPPA